MSVTCPECGLRFLQPANGPEIANRPYRCAACHHTWRADARPDPVRPEPVRKKMPVALSSAASEQTKRMIVENPPPLETPSFAVPETPDIGPAPNDAAPETTYRAERVFVPVYVDLARPEVDTSSAKSWTATYGIVALACLLAGGVVFQKQVIKTVPALEKAYELTGLKPAGNGLSISNVVTTRKENDGATQLIVRGEVENITTGSIAVPPIAVTIRGEENTPLYVWKVAPGKNKLEAGEKSLFTGISQVFPGDAKDVHLDFVKPGT